MSPTISLEIAYFSVTFYAQHGSGNSFICTGLCDGTVGIGKPRSIQPNGFRRNNIEVLGRRYYIIKKKNSKRGAYCFLIDLVFLGELY